MSSRSGSSRVAAGNSVAAILKAMKASSSKPLTINITARKILTKVETGKQHLCPIIPSKLAVIHLQGHCTTFHTPSLLLLLEGFEFGEAFKQALDSRSPAWHVCSAQKGQCHSVSLLALHTFGCTVRNKPQIRQGHKE